MKPSDYYLEEYYETTLTREELDEIFERHDLATDPPLFVIIGTPLHE